MNLLAIIGGDKVEVDKIVASAKGGGAAAPSSNGKSADKEVTAPAESNAEQLAVEGRSKEAVATVEHSRELQKKATNE